MTALGEQIAKKYGGVYTENLVRKLRMTASEERRPGGELQHPDNLEGDLGDVGLFAEPTMETTFWGRVKNTWQRLRSDDRAAALP